MAHLIFQRSNAKLFLKILVYAFVYVILIQSRALNTFNAKQTVQLQRYRVVF